MTSSADCARAVADMGASPLEVVASVASLGGCSLVDSARDSAKTAAKSAKKAPSASIKTAAKEGGEGADERLGKKIVEQITAGAKKRTDKLKASAEALVEQGTKLEKTLQGGVLDSGKDRISQAAEGLGKGAAGAPKPKALKQFEEIVFDIKKVRKTIIEGSDVRAARLARQCVKLDITLDEDWAR